LARDAAERRELRDFDCADSGYCDNTPVYTVPAGHAFMLGDNRDNSTDSRAMSAMGYVPMDNLVGRVGRIFWSMTSDGDPRGWSGSGRRCA